MAYAATAGDFPSSVTSAPRVLALQRALVWLVGASGAIVFIEPSPYELTTLAATVIFFATGLRLRLVFMPLLLLLVLLNIGYTIGAIPFLEQSEVANWIATSWYMAVTVMFFAMVISEDTAARLDMLRRGLIVGAMIAATLGVAGYFNVVFKSNLSLVGPRPHAVQGKLQSQLFDEAVDGYFARHRVKPGITGWAQINGWRGEVDSEEKIQKRVEFDLYYIENWSVLFDLFILLKTPLALMMKNENAY